MTQQVKPITKPKRKPKAKKKPKKPSKTTLMNRADKLFSLQIRERDGACVVCHGKHNLQCGHIVSRKYRSVRWDEDNAVTLCAKCHMYFTNNPVQWRLFIDKRIGADAHLELHHRAAEVWDGDYDAVFERLAKGSPARHTPRQAPSPCCEECE